MGRRDVREERGVVEDMYTRSIETGSLSHRFSRLWCFRACGVCVLCLERAGDGVFEVCEVDSVRTAFTCVHGRGSAVQPARGDVVGLCHGVFDWGRATPSGGKASFESGSRYRCCTDGGCDATAVAGTGRCWDIGSTRSVVRNIFLRLMINSQGSNLPLDATPSR